MIKQTVELKSYNSVVWKVDEASVRAQLGEVGL